MTTALASPYAAEYQAIALALPGSSLPWLAALRSEALEKFSAQGFPSPREEEWRYTNVSAIEKKLFLPATAVTESSVDNACLKSYQMQDAWSVVLVDGHFSAELSDLEDLPNDVSIMGMAEALVKQSETLEKYINKWNCKT